MSTPPAADNATATLPAEVASFIQAGPSITVAGRDERLVPSIAKGVGCKVSADRRQVTVLVFADAAEAVARDIAHNRQIAVVFSQPSTNSTVQLKGRDAAAVPTTPADVAIVRRHLALFAADLTKLGWNAEYVQAVFWHDPAQLMAIRFSADDAFAQTPGPGAGQPMRLQEAAKP